MKRILLVLAIAITSISTQAQQLPINPISGKISFIGAKDLAGKTQKQLYSKATQWALVNSTAVNSYVENKLIEAAGSFPISYTASLGEVVTYNVDYKIIIDLLEGRYNYEVTDLEVYGNNNSDPSLGESVLINGLKPNTQVKLFKKQVEELQRSVLTSLNKVQLSLHDKLSEDGGSFPPQALATGLALNADLPINNATGTISLSEVIPAEGANSLQLYAKGKEWFVVTFKSANDVLQMDDKETGTLIGKGFQDIYIGSNGAQVKNKLWYTVKIYVKDGRWKYEITDLFFEDYPSKYNLSPIKVPAERVIIAGINSKNSTLRKLNVSLKKETVKALSALSKSMKLEMAQAAIASNGESW